MTSTVLITGIGGMVGSHLSDFYLSNHKEFKVIGSYYKPTTDINELSSQVDLIECDVRYFSSVLDIIKKHMPTVIYHLAAQSFPSVSWLRPQETCDVNVTGTINIFEAIKNVKNDHSNYDPVVIIACSSAEYGQSMVDSNGFVDEKSSLLPLSPYGVSKVSQDLLAYQYFQSDGIKAIRARIFNTTGPKKVGDVLSDFIRRAVSIKNGSNEAFLVGNIDTYRAIADVRDLINALFLLSEKGVAGEAYNICGDKKYKISTFIDLISKELNIKLSPVIDPGLLRPTDEKIIFGDTSKLLAHTGWKQSYTIESTIQNMVKYWDRKLSKL